MRIIGGMARGRRIAAPPGKATRPTTDRAREALFAILGGRVHGARVLDLFAGSGAMGLEALSRGAAAAVFVEASRRACGCIRANLAALDWQALGVVVNRRLERAGQLPAGPFDLIIADPPYGKGYGDRLPAWVAGRGILAAGGLLVVEESSRWPGPQSLVPGLVLTDHRRYGDSVFWLFTAQGGTAPDSGEEIAD